MENIIQAALTTALVGGLVGGFFGLIFSLIGRIRKKLIKSADVKENQLPSHNPTKSEREKNKANKSSISYLQAMLIGIVVVGLLQVYGRFLNNSEQVVNTINSDSYQQDFSVSKSNIDEEPFYINDKMLNEVVSKNKEYNISKYIPEIYYLPLEPAFVLNFEGKSKARFMQIGLEASTTDKNVYASFKKHKPLIRNEIVLLLSIQKYKEIVTLDGKEQLRSEIIETINTTLKMNKTNKGIDNIYFTSFVMQ